MFSAFSTPSSVSSSKTSYDVFLSFRGSDTRQNFTSHLYSTFRRKHIHTFIDEIDLERGEQISPTLLETIEQSKFSVIIFSENYASSPWCLDELVKIMECTRTIGQKAIPIFYHVDPSHVSDLIGKFGEAFDKEKERFGSSSDRVQKWSSALEEAASLSGWDSSNYSNEAEFIENVSDHIMQKLYPVSYTASNELVGMHSHIEHILSRLSIGTEDVRFVGLWGMGGVGKTTIAEVLYSQISYQFDCCYFLRNVREESEKNGLIHLRNRYFSKLLANENLSIETLRVVPSFIKDSLSRMKVVIVLDDISDPSQLEALGVEEGWFGSGSRIILTSRDQKVLRFVDEIDIYHVEGLTERHALELFSMKAFKQTFPPSDYVDFLERVLNYAQGLPLALTVLGSHLLKRTREEWEIELDKLKRFPDSTVQKILEISFEDLDDVLKGIFLDISCFLKGYKKDSVIDILDGCGFPTRWGINRLSEKCLISINGSNVLLMHDLVQEMGQEIARRKGRLLNNKDIAHILKTNSWNTTVESIVLNMAEVQKTPFTFQTLSWMPKLRVIKISNVHTVHPMNTESDDCPPCLSSNLSLLHWQNYPFKSLRSSDSLVQNLVELIMPGSNVTELWNGNQFPENLKILNLQHSVHLVRLPDFSSATKLEEIYLDYCKSLQDLPPCIENLKNLKILAVSPCENLTRIPSLHSLKIFKINRYALGVVLDARGCRNLREVPDNIMGSFTTIMLDETAIQQLPPLTVADFSSSLKHLSMKNCEDLTIIPDSICELKYLYRLDLDGCLNLSKLPPLKGLCSLKWLSLEGSGILEIPTDIVSLVLLESLVVSNCKRLRSLPLLPWQLKCLEARNCASLQAASVASMAFAYFSNPVESHEIFGDFEFNFCNCIKLNNDARTKIMADACWRFKETALLPTMDTRFIIRLPGSEIPEWFSHQNKGSSLKIQLPHFSYPSYLSLAFCVVVEFDCPAAAFTRSVSYECLCCFRYDSGEESIAFTSLLKGVDESDHVLLWCSNFEYDMIEEDFSGKDVILQFTVDIMEDKRFSNIEFQVKRCGVYWVLH